MVVVCGKKGITMPPQRAGSACLVRQKPATLVGFAGRRSLAARHGLPRLRYAYQVSPLGLEFCRQKAQYVLSCRV